MSGCLRCGGTGIDPFHVDTDPRTGEPIGPDACRDCYGPEEACAGCGAVPVVYEDPYGNAQCRECMALGAGSPQHTGQVIDTQEAIDRAARAGLQDAGRYA